MGCSMPVGLSASEWSHIQLICWQGCNSRLDSATANQGSFSPVSEISAETALKKGSELEHVGVKNEIECVRPEKYILKRNI